MNLGWLIVLHAAATFAMLGLIWFVQLVHYPMLRRYERDGFSNIEEEHCNRTGFVAAPLMLLEASTGILLLVGGFDKSIFVWSLMILAMIWGSTFLLQVPCHRNLLGGWNSSAHRRLVRTNWLRTAGWTVRSLIIMFILVE